MKNKKYLLILFLIFEIYLFYIKAYAVNPDMTNLDSAGNTILYVLQKIAYWVIIVKCIMDLISSVMQKDLHSIGKTVITYVTVYAAMFFIPWAMRLVEGIFE